MTSSSVKAIALKDGFPGADTAVASHFAGPLKMKHKVVIPFDRLIAFHPLADSESCAVLKPVLRLAG